MIFFQVHEVNILSVVQYKWPTQYDYQAFIKNDYREHYTFGDPILTWDDANEEIKFLGIFSETLDQIFINVSFLSVKMFINVSFSE